MISRILISRNFWFHEIFFQYTGVCKDENDAGESVECDATETSYSCMSAMIGNFT